MKGKKETVIDITDLPGNIRDKIYNKYDNLHNGSFKNCNFLEVKLTASYFSNFEFVQTKFKNSELGIIGVSSIKVSNSEQSILNDMNLIIPIDQDDL